MNAMIWAKEEQEMAKTLKMSKTGKRKGYLVKTKFCGRCERRRVARMFRRCAGHGDGLQSWCKECFKDWDAEQAA